MIVVNLPKMLYEAILRGEKASKNAMKHANAIAAKAKASGSIEENLAAVRAFQIATETQECYATTVYPIMVAISQQQNRTIYNKSEDCETCDNDQCPENKPN